MGIKKIILGEPMPDKNDPKYKQKYERDVEAGRKFANASGLGWLSGRITIFAKNHKEAFLFITFGTVILLFSLNIIGMVISYRARHSNQPAQSVQRVDSAMRRQASPKASDIIRHGNPRLYGE